MLFNWLCLIYYLLIAFTISASTATTFRARWSARTGTSRARGATRAGASWARTARWGWAGATGSVEENIKYECRSNCHIQILFIMEINNKKLFFATNLKSRVDQIKKLEVEKHTHTLV